jgi:hypothetical protein
MLKTVLETGKKFLFIIVMSKQHIESTNCSEVLATIYHFVNLFDYENLEPDVRRKLLKSVSLIVTKAGSVTDNESVRERLEGIAN